MELEKTVKLIYHVISQGQDLKQIVMLVGICKLFDRND
jgi:hypothetical protein